MRKDDCRVYLSSRAYPLIVALFGLVFVCRFFAQEAPAPSIPQTTTNSTPSVKVDVDLVLVNATVTDPMNRFVTGLEKDHFKIFEDKVEQRVSQFSTEDMPVSIGLLFDVSSSMGEKIGRAKDAAIAFLKTTNPEDEFFLLTFADQPKVLEEFTSDFSEIRTIGLRPRQRIHDTLRRRLPWPGENETRAQSEEGHPADHGW